MVCLVSCEIQYAGLYLDPYSTYIYCDSEERATFTSANIYFGSVPTDQLDELHGKVITSIKKIVADGIDMDRIRLVIKRDKLKVRDFGCLT